MAKDALAAKWVTRGPVEDWVDETGRIVLVGEAAHPLMVRFLLLQATTVDVSCFFEAVLHTWSQFSC
jgi:hypothetical protein